MSQRPTDAGRSLAHVVFEFVGGPHDGLVVRGSLSENLYDEAEGLLWRTDGGRPGTEFWMPTEYALAAMQTYGPDGVEQLSQSGYRFPGHAYEVYVRRLGDTTLTIRARHLRAEE